VTTYGPCERSAFHFPLRYRDMQERLGERGIAIAHEAIRQWCRNGGAAVPYQQPACPASSRQRLQTGEDKTWQTQGDFAVLHRL